MAENSRTQILNLSGFNHSAGHSLLIDGANIYYEEQGNKDADPLVFLHGGFGNMENFNTILSAFSKDFHLIGIDTRGHGKSTLGKTQLSYKLIENDLVSILDHLGLETCSILGFSDGGIVGYKFASDFPKRVTKLITIGADWHNDHVQDMHEIFSKITGASWKAKFPADYEAYQKHNPQPDFDSLAKNITNMWMDTSASSYPNEQVKKIVCPVLALRGAQDHLVSSSKFHELKNLISNILLYEIEGAGHLAFVDQKNNCLEKMLSFMKS